MRIRFAFLRFSIFSFALSFSSLRAEASPGQTSSSTSAKHSTKAVAAADSRLDAGTVKNGIYRNVQFGFACNVPPGWVLRTEEMNSQEDDTGDESGEKTKASGTGHVLLATFSRPPEARGEDVNSSIVIAVESLAAYPGLKDAAQYFGPVTEIAEERGFEIANQPYEVAIGTKNLVRGDFQEDVGKRVLMQSTLAILERGYVVSFTFIGGTEDEIEELIGGLSFAAGTKAAAH
jgi:hypothetical protein